MDRMLVVVFDNESKAYEGKEALLQLDGEGSGPLGTLTGTALGSLIGLLGGPAGLAIGATVGFTAGATVDLNNARISGDFIDDVTKVLLPNSVALIAEIEEDWTTPVDTRMEELGGTVFRRALSDVEDTIDEEHIAAIKADIAQMKAEHAQARADRKAKLHEKITQLNSKLQAHLQKAKEQRQAAEREAQIKADILKAKAKAVSAKAGA